MKNVLFGLAVGVVVGYVLRRMEDTGKNQVEYVKDRVEHMVEKPKSN